MHMEADTCMHMADHKADKNHEVCYNNLLR